MNKQRKHSPHFWVSSEFQRKKLEETVSSRPKNLWKKTCFFPLWKKLANPVFHFDSWQHIGNNLFFPLQILLQLSEHIFTHLPYMWVKILLFSSCTCKILVFLYYLFSFSFNVVCYPSLLPLPFSHLIYMYVPLSLYLFCSPPHSFLPLSLFLIFLYAV